MLNFVLGSDFDNSDDLASLLGDNDYDDAFPKKTFGNSPGKTSTSNGTEYIKNSIQQFRFCSMLFYECSYCSNHFKVVLPFSGPSFVLYANHNVRAHQQ